MIEACARKKLSGLDMAEGMTVMAEAILVFLWVSLRRFHKVCTIDYDAYHQFYHSLILHYMYKITLLITDRCTIANSCPYGHPTGKGYP